MKKILDLKLEANGKYKAACNLNGKSNNNQDCDDLLKESCHLYAKCIELLGSYEIDLLEEGRERGDTIDSSDNIYSQIEILKPQLFLNLGMANARLNDYISCRKCCNIALLFCNESHIPIYDLPSITEDIDVLLPVVRMHNIIFAVNFAYLNINICDYVCRFPLLAI